MSLLPETEITAFIEAHPDWSWSDDAITRTFRLDDFSEAMGFVTRLALAAEKADHHPDLDIRWNKVKVVLTTHSEGGITARDLDLADLADSLV